MHRGNRMGTVGRATAIGAGAVALSVVAGAAPAMAQPSQACYPNNQFVTHLGDNGDGNAKTGPTSFASSGLQPFDSSEFDQGFDPVTGEPTTSTDLGSGYVQWNARGSVLGPNTTDANGGLSGSMTATFVFRGKVVKFTSRCVTEVQTDLRPGAASNKGDAEMETEGTVIGFPGSKLPRPAVASISTSDETGAYMVSFGLELGTSCAESGVGLPSQELGGISVAADSMFGLRSRTTAQNVDAGRISSPPGFTFFQDDACTPVS